MIKKISSHKIVSSLLISLWIVLTVVLLNLLHITVYWPAFTVLNLLSLIGFTKQNIIRIFLSCIVGIGLALVYLFACEFVAPYMGELAAVSLMLFLVLCIILIFDDALSICLNTHTIIVFAYCLVSVHEFAATWPQALISTLLGGGVALAGILGIIKGSAKLAKKNSGKGSEEERQEGPC